MKRSLFPAGLVCSLGLVQPLHADFEKWTRVDGKAAELDLVDVKLANGEPVSAEFETRAGKRLSMKLAELAEADQARVKSWKPGKNVRTKFKEMSGDSLDGKPRTTFSFDLQSKGLSDLVYRDEGNVIRPGAPEVIRFTSGGEAVKFESCTAQLERDPFNEPKGGEADPFGAEGKGRKPAANPDAPGILHVSLIGVTQPPNAADCEFEAKLYYQHASEPKEIEGTIDVSKTLDNLNYQKLGQFKVALEPWLLTDDRESEAEALAKRGADGYSIKISEDTESNLIVASYLVVNNKRQDGLMTEAKGSRFKVIIKYWSVVREVPFIVTKARGETGAK